MEKIIFEDLPSTKTPLNAENLNKIQQNAENAINKVDEKINKYIVNHTFTNSTTNTIDFNVDIQSNEKVEIEIKGGANPAGDVSLKINDINTGYYQSGVFYQGTGTSSQATLNATTGYRPNMAAFYYAHSLRPNVTIIKGELFLIENVDNLGTYNVCYNWNANCSMHGTQLLGTGTGLLGQNLTSISKITISLDNNKYFKAGTTVKIKKINN